MEFVIGLNGKKQEWEAMVLIPFIDEMGIGGCGVDPLH